MRRDRAATLVPLEASDIVYMVAVGLAKSDATRSSRLSSGA